MQILFSEHEEKANKSRTPSTRSFTSQQSQNLTSDSHHSPSWSKMNDFFYTELRDTYSMNSGGDNQSQKSDRNTPVHFEEDARSFPSNDKGILKYYLI